MRVFIVLMLVVCGCESAPRVMVDAGALESDASPDAYAFPDTGTFGCQGVEDCADDDACTVDTCEVETGRCMYVPMAVCP